MNNTQKELLDYLELIMITERENADDIADEYVDLFYYSAGVLPPKDIDLRIDNPLTGFGIMPRHHIGYDDYNDRLVMEFDSRARRGVSIWWLYTVVSSSLISSIVLCSKLRKFE